MNLVALYNTHVGTGRQNTFKDVRSSVKKFFPLLPVVVSLHVKQDVCY